MASRRDVFLNNSIYHIYNKTIDHRRVFMDQSVSNEFIALIRYYRSENVTLRYSYYKRLPEIKRQEIMTHILEPQSFMVELLAYCMMPTHYHLLIMQRKNEGIIKFVSNSINALTRYYNILHRRKGPVFLPQFSSRMVVSRDHLIHVSRYIHLNPYSAGIVKKLADLPSYSLSSWPEYLSIPKLQLCNASVVLKEFGNNVKRYEKFIYDHADYQRTLEYIKYMDDK